MMIMRYGTWLREQDVPARYTAYSLPIRDYER